ncbi:MAG: GNAT family N-acetyltransferase [Solirubrobacteraceae bacterium]
MIELSLRQGGVADAATVLGLFDESVEWLVERGLAGQWGEEPFSARPDMSALVQHTLRDNDVHIAEHAGETVGVLAVGSSPPYVPGSPVPELYVALLLSTRRLAGNRIGARLLELATEIAQDRSVQMIRVDCWSGSPHLVRFYENQGFTRQGCFDLRGWRGQILGKPV